MALLAELPPGATVVEVVEPDVVELEVEVDAELLEPLDVPSRASTAPSAPAPRMPRPARIAVRRRALRRPRSRMFMGESFLPFASILGRRAWRRLGAGSELRQGRRQGPLTARTLEP